MMVSEQIQARQQQLPQVICDIGWRAQVRLCGRYRKMLARGKHPNTIAAAIARELAGFMWAIANAQPLGGVAPVTRSDHESDARSAEETQPR